MSKTRPFKPTPEPWRTAWRYGLAPYLPTAGLEALRKALLGDDPRLIQGQTVEPALNAAESPDAPPARCCAAAFAAWQGLGLTTALDVEDQFDATLLRADARLEGLGIHNVGAADFLRWFDDSPREHVRRHLLPEVSGELARRAARAVRVRIAE